MVPTSLRIAAFCLLGCGWLLLAAPDDAAATGILELIDIPADSSSVGFDSSNGNFHQMVHIYRNTGGSLFQLKELGVLLFNPDELGFSDITASNADNVIAAGEAAFPDYVFSLRGHPNDLPQVNWVFTEVSVAGTNFTLTSGSRFTLPTPINLLPNDNLFVFFRVHNDILGGSTADDIGELAMGVRLVPEPSTAVLFGAGLLALIGTTRRRAASRGGLPRA